MCIRVRYGSPGGVDPYDAVSGTITLSKDWSPEQVLIAVRAVLDELCIPQGDAGATCHCGASVDLGVQLPLKRQRLFSEDEVNHIGA